MDLTATWSTRVLGAVLHITQRRRVVRQFDQIDCGPAALLTVLRYHGGDASLSHVRDLAGTDAQGTSLLGLAQAARTLGFAADGATGEVSDLAQSPLPCIVHVLIPPHSLEHYVVVFDIGPKYVRIGDPASGTRQITRAEFEVLWRSRVALLLERGPQLVRNQSTGPLQWIWRNFSGAETWFAQSVFSGVLYAGIGIAISLCIQVLIDRVIPTHSVTRIATIGALLTFLTLARAAVGLLRQHLLLELLHRVNSRIATGFIQRILRMPIRFFESRTKGDTTARLHDASRIQNAIARVVGTSITDALIVIGALAYVMYLVPAFAPIALASVAVYAAALALATRPIQADQRAVMQGNADLESIYVDTLNGISELRAYSVPGMFERFSQSMVANVQDRAKSLGVTQARATLCAEVVGGLLVLVSLLYGAVLVASGEMKLGQMMAAYSLLASTLVPIIRLVDTYIAVEGAALATARLTDLAEAEEESSTGTASFRLTQAVTLRNVAFAWPRGDALFTDLNVTISCGEITGVWGSSGAGKSTLVKLLQRLYNPASGEILIDGVSAVDIELESYRRGIAAVTASPRIFNLTLRENILLGRDEPTDNGAPPVSAAILAAIIDGCGLSQFFRRFPRGLATQVGENGRELSSGERQVIGFLRALVGQPSLLIIDEGINAIDVDMYPIVWNAIRAYAREHAVVFISHNIDALLQADHIYVLERGSIAEHGTPTLFYERRGSPGRSSSTRTCGMKEQKDGQGSWAWIESAS